MEATLELEPGNVEIRNYKPDLDEAFLYSTWLRSYRFASAERQFTANSIYFPGQQQRIGVLLNRAGARVMVAHPGGDPETILGYAVAEPSVLPKVLHWLYVKPAFRRLGVATAMLENLGLDPVRGFAFTHLTTDGQACARAFSKWNITYNPYLVENHG